MLAHVVGECWHALVRDVLAMGYRVDDIFTTLGLAEMVSIVVAAPPHSSVRWFLEGGWSREAHILANMAERESGIAAGLQAPYQRPGLEHRQVAEPETAGGFFRADPLDWNEAERRDKIRYSGRFKPRGPTRVRPISALRSVG